MAAVLLCTLGVTAAWLFRTLTYEEAQRYAERTSARVVEDVRSGSLGPKIEADPNAPIVQVFDANGKMIAATPSAVDRPPLSTMRPSPDDRTATFARCFPSGNCYVVRVVRTGGEPDAPVVMVGSPLPRFLASGLGDLFNALVVGAAIGLVGVLSWVVIGRALRPVDELRAQYEEIRASDPSRRIPEPQGEDEISRLVRTVNRTLDQMERALERQRQFASDASHELRTPIASLRANLEDALLHPDDTDFREVAEAALRATDRLELIVTDLLLLARIGTGRENSEDLDLSLLLRGEVNRDVATDIEPGLRVHAVRNELSRLFSNLLDNAHRYGGGEIRLAARRHGTEVEVAVTDEGPGIPESERERIFGRFTRLDTARSREAGGTGLGLAIAREVALAHGGSLRAEDTPRGARFVLRLPLLPEDQEPTADR
ncbi:HAMP domain-containing sensor histidine kinase [Actinocorallia sp. B10E7]|uniref:sensor histidine kinase n=1 Tax=Actinocorallia sp. B10E7 TaxID=3153558 RepID=UPI00325C48F2